MKNYLQHPAIFLAALFASTSTLAACQQTVQFADDAARVARPYADDLVNVGKSGGDDAANIARHLDNVPQASTAAQAVDQQLLEEFAYDAAIKHYDTFSASLVGDDLLIAVQEATANDLRNRAASVLPEEQIQYIAATASAVVFGQSAEQQ